MLSIDKTVLVDVSATSSATGGCAGLTVRHPGACSVALAIGTGPSGTASMPRRCRAPGRRDRAGDPRTDQRLPGRRGCCSSSRRDRGDRHRRGGGSAVFASRSASWRRAGVVLPRRKPGRRSPCGSSADGRAARWGSRRSTPPSRPSWKARASAVQDGYGTSRRRGLMRDLSFGGPSRRDRDRQPCSDVAAFGYVAAFMYEGDNSLLNAGPQRVLDQGRWRSGWQGELREPARPAVAVESSRNDSPRTGRRRDAEGVANSSGSRRAVTTRWRYAPRVRRRRG